MMNPKEDPNYVIKVEKAIVEKYGAETIQHPGQDWTPEKEQEYIGYSIKKIENYRKRLKK